jgi:hypothetical protein
VSKINQSRSHNNLVQKYHIGCPSMCREIIATTKSTNPDIRYLGINIQYLKTPP